MMRGVIAVLLAACMLALTGCTDTARDKQKQKWAVKPAEENKKPYGNYIAYQSLKYYFPEAKIETLPAGFRYYNIDAGMRYASTGCNLLILQGINFNLTSEEWEALKSFINYGNEVVLFCSALDMKVAEELNCYKGYGTGNEELEYYNEVPEKENQNVLWLADTPAVRYGYKGRWLKGYFKLQEDTTSSSADTTKNYFDQYPDTLGYAMNKPDFVRYRLGNGHLTLHAAPLVLSNYFLLQDNNINYLTAIWRTLPAEVNHVYWNSYFHRTAESPGLSLLFRYPATRLAMWLGLIALVVYLLFESKRKQRIVPVIPPLRNDSVSFVETVGRLYYNQGNHSNLAWKMIQQYLEWVRSHYFLNTNVLNEEFTKQLVMKSGQPEATVRGLMDMIHEIRLGNAYLDDAYLYQLYNTIQLFYNDKRR